LAANDILRCSIHENWTPRLLTGNDPVTRAASLGNDVRTPPPRRGVVVFGDSVIPILPWHLDRDMSGVKRPTARRIHLLQSPSVSEQGES
jgi:hypothetical protein